MLRTWLQNKTQLTAVFEAATDAPIGGGLGNIIGKLVGENAADISGGIWQNFDLVQNGNRGVYYKTWVDKIGVAVVEELPFKIRIEEPKAPLVRAGTLPIKGSSPSARKGSMARSTCACSPRPPA